MQFPVPRRAKTSEPFALQKYDGMEKPPKKTTFFGQVEDVISVGALLRPTIVKAIGDLNPRELESFSHAVIGAERELANSRLEFRERFIRAQEKLRQTYSYAPVWRFIAGRIEESWGNAAPLTVKELSLVSLLFGIMLEETQTRLQKLNEKSTKRIA